jgi:transposase
MSQLISVEKIYIGADISKATIDFFNNQTGVYDTIPNQKSSLKRFLKTLKDPAIIVFEATGGYERKLSTLLDDFSHLDRMRVHPSCVKSFARALGNPSYG